MNKYTLINKNFTLDGKISVKERGFRFGDGVFESCKIFSGRIYDFAAHKRRLELGIAALAIDFDTSDLEEKCLELIAKNEITQGVLRISVSRGQGSMGYLPAPDIETLLVVETLQPRRFSGAARLCLSENYLWKKPAFLQKCKTNQGLNYVLTKIEAKKRGFYDAILLNEEAFIAETSSSNIFWVKDEEIFTPALESGALPGCVRQKIIDNFAVKEVLVNFSELENAQEVFLTNSNLLTLSISEIEGISKPLTNEISAKIQQFLENDVINATKK